MAKRKALTGSAVKGLKCQILKFVTQF